MRRNVAGQIIGIQMTGNDGSAFTGAVTVYVAVDGGTQAVGSVGGGACTHKGNGYHVYAPAQAETDGEHVAFTFVGAGAITATAQVYTGVDVIAISGMENRRQCCSKSLSSEVSPLFDRATTASASARPSTPPIWNIARA